MSTQAPRRTREPGPAGGDIALRQVSPRARSWLFALVVVLPLGLVGASALLDERQATLGPFAGVALFCLALWAVLARLLQRHRLDADTSGLEVATTLYTRRHDWDAVDLDRARVVDLDERPEYRPMLKTNGLALPGFRSGWFRLRNGDRAFVATAGGKRLLWLPTRAGHDLVLDADDPQAALDRLRGMAAAARSR